MNGAISFFVPGEPRPKQSFRAGKNGGGFTPARIKGWQSDVGWAAQQALRAINILDPLKGNLTVTLIFFLGDDRRVDCDNLSKAVQDGLNNITWLDDQQNISLKIDKYICKTKQGVFVRIEPNLRPVQVHEEEMYGIIAEFMLEVTP